MSHSADRRLCCHSSRTFVVDDVPLLSIEMEEPLGVKVNGEDVGDLWDIMTSNAVDFCPSLRGDFLATKRSVGCTARMSPETQGVYRTTVWGLIAIGEYHLTLEQPAPLQASLHELESRMLRLRKANMKARTLRKVGARTEGEVADACAQGKCDLLALQTRASADRDMLMLQLSIVLVNSYFWTLWEESVKASIADHGFAKTC